MNFFDKLFSMKTKKEKERTRKRKFERKKIRNK